MVSWDKISWEVSFSQKPCSIIGFQKGLGVEVCIHPLSLEITP